MTLERCGSSSPASSYQDICQASKCNDHRAVNKVNHNYGKNLDVTGIGACACGRHGCFFPHCVVDFQKGERWGIFAIHVPAYI